MHGVAVRKQSGIFAIYIPWRISTRRLLLQQLNESCTLCGNEWWRPDRWQGHIQSSYWHSNLFFFVSVLSLVASILTLTLISCDRFFGIVFALKARLTQRRWKTFILVLWIIAVSISAPLLFYRKQVTRYAIWHIGGFWEAKGFNHQPYLQTVRSFCLGADEILCIHMCNRTESHVISKNSSHIYYRNIYYTR